MPITSAAKKALKVSKRQRKENDITRAQVKGAVKGARLAIDNKTSDIESKLSLAYREIDMASKKKVIHRNRAARMKSRLMKKLAKSKSEHKLVTKKK